MHGVITPYVQDFAFPVDKINEIPAGSVLQAVRAPWKAAHSSCLSIASPSLLPPPPEFCAPSASSLKVVLCPFIRVLHKDVKQE